MFILLCSRQQTRLIAGVVLLCVSSSAFAVEYTFRQVVDLTGLVNHIYGPSLNDQGATAFTAFLPDGSYAMFATTPPGQLLTIASNAQGYYGLDPSSGGFPSINNSNTIAFAASTGEYPFRAIYRSFSFGEPIVFQQISSEPGGLQGLQEPWISNSNAIVYRASIAPSESIPSGLTALMRGSLPVVTGPPATTSFQWPDINSIDSVVAVGSGGLYLNSNIVYQHNGSSAAINDSGTVAFLTGAYGTLGIYTGNGNSDPTLYATSTGGTAMGHPDINNDGLIAYIDRQGGAETIFVGPAHERLLSNSNLFGSFVSSVQFFRGLNNHGQIAFAYQLGNGKRGIALATPRDPAVLGNGDFNNGLGLFQLINNTNDGFAFVTNIAGDPRFQGTAVDGVISLRQSMDTSSGDPYQLAFDFDWLTNAGALDVVVNDVLALTIGANGSITSSVGLPTVQSLGELTHVSVAFNPANITIPPGGYIRFDLHPGSQATIQLDNIVFSPLATPSMTGDFNGDGVVDAADYVVLRKTDIAPAGYNAWRAHFGQAVGSGTVSSSTASSPVVPEPASVALFLAGIVGAMAGIRRSRFVWTV